MGNGDIIKLMDCDHASSVRNTGKYSMHTKTCGSSLSYSIELEHQLIRRSLYRKETSARPTSSSIIFAKNVHTHDFHSLVSIAPDG